MEEWRILISFTGLFSGRKLHFHCNNASLILAKALIINIWSQIFINAAAVKFFIKQSCKKIIFRIR